MKSGPILDAFEGITSIQKPTASRKESSELGKRPVTVGEEPFFLDINLDSRDVHTYTERYVGYRSCN